MLIQIWSSFQICFFQKFKMNQNIFILFGWSEFSSWCRSCEVFCSRRCREAAVLTRDKVKPAAHVDVFTIWITAIIPLLCGNMLPDSHLTSFPSDLCSDVINLFVQSEFYSLCVGVFLFSALGPKMKHKDVSLLCDLTNRQHQSSFPKW